MIGKNCTVCLSAAALAVVAVAGSIAIAQPSKDHKAPAGQPEMKLPAGWSEADMQACMAAGTPGKMHEHLTNSVGVWHGKETMWMAPDTEPMTTECTSTITALMDGRYTKCDLAGDMPGMGPFNGMGITGYDNVSQKFVGTWIDNHGTGIMQGTGELSADGKTMTWNYTYNCPMTKKPAVMRQVETMTGAKTMTMEMFANDPKSGKEFKMLRIEFTKK